MMYTMPKNLLSICVNFALATQQTAVFHTKQIDFLPLLWYTILK